MLPLLMGLAIPLIKGIAGKFMEQGLNLAANAITGGGKKAKEYIEKKTGISLNDPDKLTIDDMAKVALLEKDPEAIIELKKLSLEILKEENRHGEAVEQNWGDIVETLSRVDCNGNSTRPMIAKWMAQIVGFAVIVFTSALAVSIFNDATETLKQLSNAWPLMLAILATPTALLRSYFGMRTKEKKARYDMVSPLPSKNIASDILSMFKKQ